MEPKRSVFVLDIDDNFRSSLTNCFQNAGFTVFEGNRSSELFDTLENQPVDLITLGSQPGAVRGLDILRDLNQISSARVIMINDSTDLIDLVISLEMGADDCLSKPVLLRELLARSRSILRRSSPAQTIKRPTLAQYIFENWTMTPESCKLINTQGKSCELTRAEFRVLEILVKKSGNVLSRQQILDALDIHTEVFYERSIDNHVAQLRKKITCESSVSLIKTIRNKGYMLNVPVQLRGEFH